MKSEEKSNIKEYFIDEIKNYTLIDLLCLKIIVQQIHSSRTLIHINDISASLLSSYWRVDFNKDNSKYINQELNEIKRFLISKYGLTEESPEQDIEQIINYIEDRTIKLKLLAITKATLQKLSKLPNNSVHSEELKLKLNKKRLDNQSLLTIKGNDFVTVNKHWFMQIKNDNDSKRIVDEIIQYKLDSKKRDSVDKEKSARKDTLNKEANQPKDFTKIKELEKLLKFHLSVHQKQFYCIEEALGWLKMDLGLYEEIHEDYVAYARQFSVQAVAKMFPFVSSAMLLYTAVYRYNEDDASGFWPEFFENQNYNYQRDVPYVMKCLKDIVREYNIDFKNRQYLQKTNLSVIFSQIYIPDISLRKIYSSIYIYYFRNNKFSKAVNRIDFLNNNEYRLDKPGVFFLSKDEKFKDTFYDLVELVKSAINNPVSNKLFDFPERFYKALSYWKDNEKQELDTRTVEFYISSPNIYLDYINSSIYINLPAQKNRIYSDGDFGWNIIVDNKKKTIYGRIIRKNSGDYLILEEKYKLKSPFKSITIEYFYNDELQKSWEFKNEKIYFVFNKDAELQKNDTLSREGCYLGVPKKTEINKNFVIESFIFDEWNEYKFYQLDLAEYSGNEIHLGNNVILQIEDKPVIKRRDYKLLFGGYDTQSVQSINNIYEEIGTIDIITPFIDEDDFRIELFDLESDYVKEEFEINKINQNLIRLKFEDNLRSGNYNIIIKYKDKTCYTESFIYDRSTKVKFCVVDYKKEHVTKMIEVYGNNNISITPYDLNTKVKKINNNFYISTKKMAISRFIYRFKTTEILINKIVRPIKYDLSGLEEIIESKSNDRVIEITKEVLHNHLVNLYIRNLDYNHEYLIYKLFILDNVTSKKINITEKLKFGQEINWNFNNFKDRIVNFKNASIVLEISDSNTNVIARIPVMNIKEYIKINNFKQLINDKKLFISWDEEQVNKERRLYLYNITIPSENPIEYDLKAGITNLKLDLTQMYTGIYVPIIKFKKESSLFDINEGNRQFFKKKDIANTIVNNSGCFDTRAQYQLLQCVWMTYEEKYKTLNAIVQKLDFSSVDLESVLYTIIQMKNFSDFNDNESVKSFLSSIYKILQETFNHIDKDTLIKMVINSNDDLGTSDMIFLLNCIIAFDKHNNLSSEAIDGLAEIDLASALCALDNGQKRLSNNIILECSKKIDRELLAPDIHRNHNKIFEFIGNEMRIISEFWNWLIKRDNKYLLSGKYDFSKTRMYRMYEEENKISTHKVLGKTLDDMVDNMINNNLKVHMQLPVSWSYDLNVDKEIYNGLVKTIKENNQSQFKDSIIAAFVDITKPSKYSNEEYFNLVMTCQMSNQKDIFNRYRTYFKLMFI